jgi:uncharacterized membrane protein required for colicin V production
VSLIDFIVIVVLIMSVLSGLKDGAVKALFSLLTLFIAIPLAGLSYPLLSGIFSFLPGTAWENFVGFFIVFGIISAILQLVFFLPRKIMGKIWGKGILFRLLGAAASVIGAGISLTVFVLVLDAYPVISALQNAVSVSAVVMAITGYFSFVALLLPEMFRSGVSLTFNWRGI